MVFGGGEVQAASTAKYLNRYGYPTDLCDLLPSRKLLSDYQIVHIFDHTDAFFPSVIVRKVQKRLVFTPIYWPEQGERGTFQKLLTYTSLGKPSFLLNQIRKPYSMSFYMMWRSLPRWMEPLANMFKKMWTYPFQAADLVIVNAIKEKELISKVIGKEVEAKTRVVYNGVDDEIYGKSPDENTKNLFREKYRIKDYVLSMGRIEPRKNQLSVVKAAKRLNLPLVLVGRKYDRYYARKVFKEFGSLKSRHVYIDYLEHDSDMLISAYLNARVVASPSTLETPGLVALEAASLGRTVLVTEVGTAPEYFGKNAYYVNPDNQGIIEERLWQAWNKPTSEEKLRNYILQKYTWKKAALNIMHAYKEFDRRDA